MDRDEAKRRVCEAIAARKAEAIGAARTMLGHPELGFRETRTSALVRDAFAALELPVREGLALTGVEATLAGGAPGPAVVVMGELDAVICPGAASADPATGAAHQCGHHVQVGAMLGAATGLVHSGVAGGLAGSVRFLGVPAEEYVEIEHRLQLQREGKLAFLGGKQELIARGYFDGVAACMMVHAFPNAPEPGLYWGGAGNGFLAKFVRYEGKAAHAGAVPHEGVNALNAACLAILAVHAQRETFRDEDAIRVHPIITRGGDVVNVVPADVRLETYVRGRTLDAILDASRKVDRALRAGGDAVGADTTIQNVPGYLPLFQDAELTRLGRGNGRRLLGERGDQEAGFMGGSFDIGDLSHLLPCLHPFAGGTRGSLHTRDFAVTDYEAAVVAPAKVFAMSVIDLLWDGGAGLRQVQAQFRPRLTARQYLELMEGLVRPA
jgi:amidohydrolase